MPITIIDTPHLRVACHIAGPSQGEPLLLLHGWPDDAHSWDAVLAPLHAQGWRTYAPYLRGCGPTRFHTAGQPRSGQLAALGQDALELAGALGLDHFVVAGHDWGARAAYIAAVLAPQSVRACIALSVGWGTNDPAQALSLQQTQNYWYHWLMALDRGATLVHDERRQLTRYIWDIWNPRWRLGDAEFEALAASFDNPDWAELTVHSYRVRWGLAVPDPAYAPIEARLRADPMIRVPTLVIHGGADPCNDPATSANKQSLFADRYQRVVLDGVGHFPQREAPTEVAAAMLGFLAG